VPTDRTSATAPGFPDGWPLVNLFIATQLLGDAFGLVGVADLLLDSAGLDGLAPFAPEWG
jgi:hypothetical protein